MVLLQWHKQAQVARQNESLVVAFSQERWIELRPKNKHSRFCRPAKNGSIAHWLLQPLQQYFFVGAAGTAPKPDGAAVVVVALFKKAQHGGVVEVGVGFDAGQAETAGMVFNKIEEEVRQALANPGIGQSYAVHLLTRMSTATTYGGDNFSIVRKTLSLIDSATKLFNDILSSIASKAAF